METQPHLVHGSSPVPTKILYPHQTVRCIGPVSFRSQLVRDVACLLDVDDDVLSWSCLSENFEHGADSYRPDLIVERYGRRTVNQAYDMPDEVRRWLPAAVRSAGFEFRLVTRGDLPPTRLRNARDLLRYAKYDATLDDRIRLLAGLEEHGSLTVAECLTAFRSHSPVAGLASLILSRFVTVDLDNALIGPETIVRRHRD